MYGKKGYEESKDMWKGCVEEKRFNNFTVRYVLETKLKDSSINEKDSLRLLQYLTMVLMSVYGHRELVRKASMQVCVVVCVCVCVCM